jgi:hypothetical protein
MTSRQETSGRERFRRWRRARPFWAGVSTAVATLLLVYLPYATLRVGEWTLSLGTLSGAAGLTIAVLLLVCAGAMWFRPEFRLAAGLVVVVLSLVALVTVNLGSFLFGTIFGIVGGSLAVAWTPAASEGGAGRG